MFKMIINIIEARRQRKHWRYMTKLMRESGPVVVQTYPVKQKKPAPNIPSFPGDQPMLDDHKQLPPATQDQGSLFDRYEIYLTQAESMGWEVKSFDEWLAS